MHPQWGFSCTGGVWHTGELDWTREQSSAMKILSRKFLLRQGFYPEAQALTSHVCKLQSLSMKCCMSACTVPRVSSGLIIETTLLKVFVTMPPLPPQKCKEPEEDLVSKTHENRLNHQRNSSSTDTPSTQQGSWTQGWVQGEGRRLQAVTGRLVCGGPSGLASGPRQGLMQPGRPLSIPPAKRPAKVRHTEPLVTAMETGCTDRAEHTGDGPGDPRDGGRASGGLSVLPQQRGRRRQRHSGGHTQVVMCCTLMATCRCGGV